MSEGEGGDERWLLTYSDLITLLLAFFIILYAGSKADLEKFGQLARGLAQAFGTIGLEGGGDTLMGGGTGVFDVSQISAERRQFMVISEKLQAYASEQGLQGNIAVNLRKEGIAVTLSNALLFPSGGVELSAESQDVLHNIADLIRSLPNEIRIEAHTDNLPTDSPLYPTNWELSAARAARVARYLNEVEGIEAGRLSVLGYGEQRPLYPNDTRHHRSLNRRADIVILYPTEKPAPVFDMGSKQE